MDLNGLLTFICILSSLIMGLLVGLLVALLHGPTWWLLLPVLGCPVLGGILGAWLEKNL